MNIEETYDEMPFHIKESASMPFNFHQLSLDQQMFFKDLVSRVGDATENNLSLAEDLEMIKYELGVLIAELKK